MYDAGFFVSATLRRLLVRLDRHAGESKQERAAFLVAAAGALLCLTSVLLLDYPLERSIDTLISVVELGSWEARQHPVLALISRLTLAAAALRLLWAPAAKFITKNNAKAERNAVSACDLHFKSPSAALSYACEFLTCGRGDGDMIVGIATKITDDIISIEAASKGGPVFAIAKAQSGPVKNPEECIGQLCAVVVGPYVQEAGLYAMLGVALLEPSYGASGWKVRRPL
jgi:hypothetical protein